MSRWIVIGGAGLTGTNLANKLIKQLKINSSDIVLADLDEKLKNIKLPVKLSSCDISKNIFPQLKKNDIIIHLAARQYHSNVPWKNRLKWFREVNVEGTKNLLNAIGNIHIKGLIFFSTDMVYGYPQSIPVKHNHPKKPIGPYGKSKSEAEEILLSAQKRGLRLTVLRPRLIIGPGRLGVMKKLFTAISLNRPIPIIGSGNNYYQMVSVDDCSNAIILSVKNNFPPYIFNLGSNPELKIKDLLKNFINEVSSGSSIFPLPAKPSKFALNFLDLVNLTILYPEQYRIADKNCIVDISNTKALIGWHPKYSDLEMMIAAYRKWNES